MMQNSNRWCNERESCVSNYCNAVNCCCVSVVRVMGSCCLLASCDFAIGLLFISTMMRRYEPNQPISPFFVVVFGILFIRLQYWGLHWWPPAKMSVLR